MLEAYIGTLRGKTGEAEQELRAANQARHAAILADLAQGTHSTEAIGARHGLTGSRVRQIRGKLRKAASLAAE